MYLRICFHCAMFSVALFVVGLRALELGVPTDPQETATTRSLLNSASGEGDEEESFSSGYKRFGEPLDVDEHSDTSFNAATTSSVVDENAPEIKNQDISPEQELLMASTQDSSYQEANLAGADGQDLDTLTGRSLELEHTSTSELDDKLNLADEDEDGINSLISDSMVGNFTQNEGDSDDETPERQSIAPIPTFHDQIQRPVPMRIPLPYPASIHVRLPGQVNVVPRLYAVHHYRNVPYPVRYHKHQDVATPYYIPYKTGMDVEDTHLDVYHPGK